MEKQYRILVVNPGSTSTKIAVFQNEQEILKKTMDHSPADLPGTGVQEQLDFREQYPDAWDWIDSFGTFSIYEILPDIIDLWYKNERTISKGKNGVPAPPGK